MGRVRERSGRQARRPHGVIKTLWDLVRSAAQVDPGDAPVSPSTRSSASTKSKRGTPRARPAAPPAAVNASMRDRYDAMTREMLATHGVHVRKWRTAMTGVAWEAKDRNGSMRRWIEAPQPRGPMSAAVFLHEIGHHAIGLGAYRPRCLEEYHAWAFAISEMEQRGLNVTDGVRRRMHASLHYAIAKAGRRGLKRIPPELEPFVAPPVKKRRKAARG